MKTSKEYRKPWPGCGHYTIPAGTPIEEIPHDERTGSQTHRIPRDYPGNPFLIGKDCLLIDFDFYPWELELMRPAH